uniref:non-specific serine/threonine protein kinase n=1 Tax=Globisporangium ultimum (strain ATCC 200006 / CBS 805.95 / DAOM BR144) TaxID=431595 RepID=K3WTL6_GLOUD
MGNAAPRAQPQSQLDSASQYRTYLMDYSPRSMNIMFGSLIGDGKFLKTIYCKCDEGHLVVKIYRKFDPNEDLRSAHNSLKRISLAFTIDQQPNLIPYADYKLSLKYNVAFMVRQYFGSNLYDRICSRPFLTQIEKKWIAFQILRALEQSHSKGICHGDIKQENIMVTSWNWVFLTDFAPFKPTYIPEDDPADYNYYFCAIDATRRGCSVAPERFYGTSSATPAGTSSSSSAKGADAMMLSRMADSEVSVEEVEKQFLSMGIPTPSHAQTPTSVNSSFPGSMPSFMRNANKREGHLQESMDIFSAGCVIAEIFLGGKPLFELPTLLRYRTGDTEHLRNTLKKVGDPRLEEMLLHMLQLDPNARASAADYLAKYTSNHGLFPTYFESFLFRFLVLVLSRGGKVPDARIRLVCKYYGRLVREVTGVEDPEGEEFFKLRLREGYGSDRQLVMDLVAADGQTHVAQRVIEELDRKSSFKGENRRNEKDNGTMAKLEHMKSEEVDMTNLSGTFQKKKINKLHDQYNALTQKKKQSLLLDYTAETQNEKADGENGAELKEQDEYGEYTKRSNKSNFSDKARKDRLKSSSTRKASGEPWSTDRNGIVIILSLVCSSIRHCEIPESKITAVYLIKSLGQYASDEVRLQRLIPFLMELFEDPSASVRALALRTLTLLLSLIETFPLSDASIFPQYILPALNSFPSDPDEMVRIAFAECLPQLAATSRRFLEIAHAMKQKSLATSTASQTSVASMSSRGGNEISSGVSPVYLASNSFDKELNVLHKMISRYVIQLAAPDQKASSSLVKRALLVDITRLCVFFGRERTLDVVLPQLITFLNDRDWELRGAFFDYIVGLCSFVGRVTVGLYILPCIEQALFDVQEIVITKAVECLGGLCQLGLFQKNTSALVEKAKMTSALLLHPSWWIRDAVLKLMTYIAIQMGSVDANVFLSPLLRPFMKKTMVFLLDEHEQDMLIRLRDCCRPHLSRETFDAALIASSAGSNEIIAEMENYLNLMANDTDTADTRGGGNKKRDVLSSVGISVDSGSTASSPVNTIYSNATFGSSTGSGNAGMPTANGSGAGIYASYSHRSWRPRKNVLVAELAEHTGAVNRIGAAQDFSFLASSSNDGTVKLWSIRSMQHSINQGSRCTYDGQGGVLTDMVVLENSHSVASASSNGSVHVFRVDKVNAVGGNFHATGLKDIRTENSAVMVLDYFNNVSESLLIYATRNGEIHAWDLRMRREAWKLEVSPELGYITCMTHSLDVSWFAVGTSRGFICLWDLRFLVMIRIWRHSSHRSIHRLKSCLGLPNTLPLDETSVPLVFVAAGDGEVAVFDLSIGACRAVFRTLHVQASEAEAGRCPTLLHIPIPHRSRSVLGSLLGIYGIATAFDDIATTLHSEEPSVRAILCPSLHFRGMTDALITGGEDKQIRYWDVRNGKSSYTVCGSGEAKSFYDNQAAPNDWWRMSSSHQQQMNGSDAIVATPSSAQSPAPITKPELAWKKLSPPGITICQDSSYYGSQGSVSSVAATGGGVESAVTMERRGLIPPSPAHTDCILDLTLVDLNGPMLVSSSRDGNIKVWK